MPRKKKGFAKASKKRNRDFSKAAFEEDKVVVATCIRKPGWLPISRYRLCSSSVAPLHYYVWFDP
jgi:hypothetical protein